MPDRSARPRAFLRGEAGGVATIDWLVLLGGLTLAATITLEITTGALTGHSRGLRDEVQDDTFRQTEWTEAIPVQVDRSWRGNNGHGNDADGCDASNPGNSPNCVGDTTDDDGLPGNG